ncbi:MAG: hypothetical protein VB089_22560 [Anaerolineaceae bacterium]|nr:hypothetical protein [Anaerolineaceae bacterium]
MPLINERISPQIEIFEIILNAILADVPNIAVRLWDGQLWGNPSARVTLAQARIAQAGVGERCRVIVKDYRECGTWKACGIIIC